MERVREFFEILFDFSFTRFITTKLATFLYTAIVVIIGVSALFASLGARLSLGSTLMILFGSLVLITVSRLWIEAVIAVFRLTEHAAELVAQGRRREVATINTPSATAPTSFQGDGPEPGPTASD